MSIEIKHGDTYTIRFTLVDTDMLPVDADAGDANVSVSVYEDNSATPAITVDMSYGVLIGGTAEIAVGEYCYLCDTSQGAFEVGKTYNVRVVAVIGGLTYKSYVERFILRSNEVDDLATVIAGLNDLSAADVNAECDTAISDADLPTAADVLATMLANADSFKASADAASVLAAFEAADSYKAIQAFAKGKVVIADGAYKYYDTDGTTLLFTITPAVTGRTVV